MGRDMARKLRQVGWASLLFSSAILGCTKTAIQQKTVPDPLLVTKPPVEGRTQASQASPIHRSEFTPPPSAPPE
jgi:hypothetical protein